MLDIISSFLSLLRPVFWPHTELSRDENAHKKNVYSVAFWMECPVTSVKYIWSNVPFEANIFLIFFFLV